MTLPCPSGWAEASFVRLTFAGQSSTAVGFLGQLGVAPFRERRLVMRVIEACQICKPETGLVDG